MKQYEQFPSQCLPRILLVLMWEDSRTIVLIRAFFGFFVASET